MLTWSGLQKRFAEIVVKAGGPSKGSSGNITVGFEFEGTIYVSIGAYDIGDWNRFTTVGRFQTERQALEALSAKLDEAEKEVDRVVREDHDEDWENHD